MDEEAKTPTDPSAIALDTNVAAQSAEPAAELPTQSSHTMAVEESSSSKPSDTADPEKTKDLKEALKLDNKDKDHKTANKAAAETCCGSEATLTQQTANMAIDRNNSEAPTGSSAQAEHNQAE